MAHVLLGLWGIAMGMQSAPRLEHFMWRVCFRTAATATIIFLLEYNTNGSATVEERRRLAGVLVSLFVGASAGGLLLVRAHIYAPVLPFMITVGLAATAAIVLPGHDAADDRKNSTIPTCN